MKTSNNCLKLGLQRQTTAEKADEPSFSEELSSSDTMTVRTLTLDEEATYIVEESTGVDPYNTGRFNAAKS
jgi:hypothetical protein